MSDFEQNLKMLAVISAVTVLAVGWGALEMSGRGPVGRCMR